MLNRILSVLSLIIALSSILYVYSTSKKTAFVRSEDLVYGFQGMIDAQESFEEEIKVWDENLDSLKSRYNSTLQTYQDQLTSLTEEQKREYMSLLGSQQENVFKYRDIVAEKKNEKELIMLEGLLSEINILVEQYAQKNNYDLILGTTTDGNILYGNKGDDITDEVLRVMNDQYFGAE